MLALVQTSQFRRDLKLARKRGRSHDGRVNLAVRQNPS